MMTTHKDSGHLPPRRAVPGYAEMRRRIYNFSKEADGLVAAIDAARSKAVDLQSVSRYLVQDIEQMDAAQARAKQTKEQP